MLILLLLVMLFFSPFFFAVWPFRTNRRKNYLFLSAQAEKKMKGEKDDCSSPFGGKWRKPHENKKTGIE